MVGYYPVIGHVVFGKDLGSALLLGLSVVGGARVGRWTRCKAWVFQNNGDDIKVDLPGYKGGASATPPAISVVAGWNLIPVVSLTVGNETVPTGVDKDGYLWGIDWVKAKGWDATNEQWDDVVPDTAALAFSVEWKDDI